MMSDYIHGLISGILIGGLLSVVIIILFGA